MARVSFIQRFFIKESKKVSVSPVKINVAKSLHFHEKDFRAFSFLLLWPIPITLVN